MYLFDPEVLSSWEKLAVIAGFAVPAALFVIRWVWRLGKRIFSSMKQLLEAKAGLPALLDKLSKLESAIAKIGGEVCPNGGHSLRDAIDRIEQKQHYHEQRTKLLLSHSSYGSWESDPRGNLIWASDILLRMAGVTMSEIQGASWANIVSPNERAGVFDEWSAAVEQQRNYRQHYHLVNNLTGKIVYVEARAVVMRNRDGSVGGFLGTVTPLEDING